MLLQLLQDAGVSLQQRRVAAQFFRAVINMDLVKPAPPALAPAAAALRQATMSLIGKLEVSTSSALANEIDSRSDLVLDRSGALVAARPRRSATADSPCVCADSPCVCDPGASFVLILEALCDHVYQHAQPAVEPLPLQPSSFHPVPPLQSFSPASDAGAALAPEPVYSGSTAPPAVAAAAASTSCAGHGMVVDTLESLPSIHARRSVVIDSNGASFSVDDVTARRLRKEQRRKKAQQEAEGVQSGVVSANIADEKANAAQLWTDVPPEFCCGLNGSLMKQPVLNPRVFQACALALRVLLLCCVRL